MAGEPLVEPQQLFANSEAVRVPEGESGVVHDHADVADVIVDPLELEQDEPDQPRARRHLAAGERFERLTEGHGVADARVAGDPFGQLWSTLES